MRLKKTIIRIGIPMVCIVSITTGCNSVSAIDKNIEKSKLIVMEDKPLDVLIEQDEELQQKLIEKLRIIFDIGEEYKYTKFKVFEGYDVVFKKNEKDSKAISVFLNKDMIITRYDNTYIDPYRNQDVYELKANISKNEQEKYIKNFEQYMEKISPGILDEVELDKINLGNQSYVRLDYVRKENGVQFFNDTLYASLNSNTGEITSIQFNSATNSLLETAGVVNDNMVIPDKENIISKDEAKKIFKDKVGLELLYKLDYKTKVPYLFYSIKNPSSLIDAKTKKTLDYYSEDERISLRMGKSYYYYEEPLTQKEKDSMISEKEAEEIAREYLDIGENYKIENKDMDVYILRNKYDTDDWLWELRFWDRNGDTDDALDIVVVNVNARTKEVRSFNKRKYEGKREEKYNKKDTLKLAKDFTKKAHPEKFEKTSYIGDEELSNGIHRFKISRIENGIHFIENGFIVDVDPQTGDIVGFFYDWDNIDEFSDKQDIITKEEAYETLLNNYDFDLRYTILEDDKGKRNIIKLVYGVDFYKEISLDARTGEVLGENDEKIIKVK
ncbi:hypothetical protein Curi_c21430 [Gottschalkia acidurici 9a]|uniref:YcdB/YcdC repeated domain-containing protein n=1 Tax=Gottschalkia acidurici (strain ATCC 7906 / DSM 604 / BCRC 14475 / CIP 104303 / KCTC 5404 / NCIMB 10678 / 9a) TaxID=1128398 RepID=K0B3E3_GOTA9|nr:YcdB/YcdC domain-containing protein [Gottschalkia acidurici]AFS79146.1 hypothetical protein Curi_c21430 [Gottschalkia acidurici 9a]